MEIVTVSQQTSRQVSSTPFQDDPDAQRAIVAVGSRVAEFARATRAMAHAQFRTDMERQVALNGARQMKADIESRFRSGGIVAHEMEAAWAAAVANAARVLGRKIELFPLPAAREPIQPSTLKRRPKWKKHA